MSPLEAAIYGLVQGLTEFLPVSSSAHLALYARLVNWPKEDPLFFPVLMHAASLLALIVVFRRELEQLFREERRLGYYVCIATVPALVAGAAFHGLRERMTNDPTAVCSFLIVTGFILIAGDWLARGRKTSPIKHGQDARATHAEQAVTLWKALAVGMAQAVSATFPGISRSGSTISTGRAAGLTREASVRFAFLLSIPAIAAAAGYEGLKTWQKVRQSAGSLHIETIPTLIAFVVALVSSYLAIVALIRIVRRVGLWVFAPYCFAVGLFGLIYFWRG